MMLDAKINKMVSVIANTFKSYRNILLSSSGDINFDSKQDGSPVTALDVVIENKLKQIIKSRWPNVGVGGEESGYSEGFDTFWLFDPIDGTKSFIEGKPSFTNMGVLIQNNEILASLIYNPSTDRLFTAIKGNGEYINQTRINIEEIKKKSKIVMCKPVFIDAVRNIVEPYGFECVDYQSDGGNGLTMVADGTVAARLQIHGNGSPHDYAPGAFLIIEAGGAAISLDDTPYTYTTTSFIACNQEFANVVHENIVLFRKLAH